jgi:hypothetical protein
VHPDKAVFLDRFPRIFSQVRDRRRKMKGKEDKSQEWITDCETTLKYNLDQFQLARLVDNFHLVPFDLETGRVIRFYEELGDGFLLYYGSSKFKRDEVEKFFNIRNLEDEVIKLQNQRENILFLRACLVTA